MKKWIFGGLLAVVCMGVFAFCCGKLSKEENYCYYKQELNYSAEDKTLNAKQTVGFFNYTNNVLNCAYLHLYPNAFREGSKASVVSIANKDKAYPNGESYGNINIESVSANNDYLNYKIAGEDENILIVEFNKEVYPDETFEFEIGFSVKLANVNHRLGYGQNTINICNYYPILCVYENGEFVTSLYNSNGDPFYSKCANYEVEFTYNKQYTLASTGKQNTRVDNQNKITKIVAKKVRDFAMVLSDKFTLYSDSYSSININYYYYNDTTPTQTMTAIMQVLQMNEKYAKYPYSTLSVAQSNFVHGGMEYPTLVLISDNLNSYEDYINVVVHELCHQWWYGVVGNDQYKYGFLDEGLTDFNTALFYDVYPTYKHSSAEIFKNATNSYAFFVDVYKGVVPDFKTQMIKPLNQFDTENEYVYVSYVKGMLMFATLKDMLGDKTFTRCVKYYYNSNKFKEASPNDLINCFSKASNKNLSSFFNSWFNGEDVIINFD